MSWLRGAIAALALGLATAGIASAQSPRPLTLAAQVSTDVPQLLLAIDGNAWRAEGLEVQATTFSSGREAFEALLGGQADLAVLTEYPAVIGALRGQKFQILADFSRYSGLRAIASRKWMNLDSLKDLGSKRVGTTLGTNVEFVTALLLREGGATAEVMNAAPADTVPALARGDIHAAVMFPNLYAQAKRLLAGDYQEIRTKAYSSHTLLVATPDLVANRPAELQRFLAVLARADATVAGNPEAAQSAVLKALKGVMTPEVLKDIWADYEHRLVLKPDLVALMRDEAAWIVQKGYVKAPAEATSAESLRRYINEKPLAAILPANVTLAGAN